MNSGCGGGDERWWLVVKVGCKGGGKVVVVKEEEEVVNGGCRWQWWPHLAVVNTKTNSILSLYIKRVFISNMFVTF